MSRAGHNPMKKMARRFEPKRVTACSIVYIPELAGYWEQSFDVLKVCLSSLRSSTTLPFDLVVLDNGSCPEVREFLVDLNRRGAIQILMLSHENMGKIGAWNVLFPACPGELIAFSDSDILFRPGWLERSIEVIEAFPDVGMVTGRPGRTAHASAAKQLSATLQYAQTAADVEVKRGDLIPAAVLDEFARSIAGSADPVLTDRGLDDVRLTRRSVSAYAYAGHYQFVIPRAVALATLPIESSRAVGAERLLDERLNANGKLRLGITDPLVHHLGNVLEDAELAQLKRDHRLHEVIAETHRPSTTRGTRPVVRSVRALARVRVLRALLRRTYLALFEGLQ